MPTYEFKCPHGHTFEKFYRKIAVARKVKCPTCGKPAKQLISAGAGLVFKGSGFYITDYKRAGEAKPAESEAKKPDTETKKPDAGGDAKSHKKSKDRSTDK